jgi:hypothetical protein
MQFLNNAIKKLHAMQCAAHLHHLLVLLLLVLVLLHLLLLVLPMPPPWLLSIVWN